MERPVRAVGGKRPVSAQCSDPVSGGLAMPQWLQVRGGMEVLLWNAGKDFQTCTDSTLSIKAIAERKVRQPPVQVISEGENGTEIEMPKFTPHIFHRNYE